MCVYVYVYIYILISTLPFLGSVTDNMFIFMSVLICYLLLGLQIHVYNRELSGLCR